MPTATINGFKHYYEDIGKGEPLVMLHGANSSAASLEEHFPELSKTFRVIAPDFRSLGRSEHVKTLPPNAWVEDLRGLLDHLGIQQANIFGVSLGSRVAHRFGIDHPERAKSLIINSPHTYLDKELNDNMNRSGGNGRNLAPEEQARMQRTHGADWMDALQNYYNIRNVAALQQYYNLRVSKPKIPVVGDYSESANKVKCPILVIQSENVSRGWSTFHHAIELKEEMPNQVKLAIVPSFDPRQSGYGVPGPMLRMLITEFVASLSPVKV